MIKPKMRDKASDKSDDAKIDLQNGVLCIQGNVHFDNVVVLYQKGVFFMKNLQDIKVNFRDLLHTDSSILPLLTAWVRESKAQNKGIVFMKMPNFVFDLARVCGLEEVLPILWEN